MFSIHKNKLFLILFYFDSSKDIRDLWVELKQNVKKFNTKNVTDMTNMFSYAAKKSSTFTYDCRGWNVNNVTFYEYFNLGADTKIIPPVWKH